MEASTIDMFLARKGENFPAECIPVIREKLAAIPESKKDAIMFIELKQPLTMLIFSIFLGGLGVDRFLLGDTGMGVLKLLTAGGCGVLWLIDLFLIMDKTKQANYLKLTQTL